METIDRKYFDVIITANEIKKARDRGDNGAYIRMVFRLALDYSELFKSQNTNNIDRSCCLNILRELLPEFFDGLNFDEYFSYNEI